MKLTRPSVGVSQHFGANANPLYSGQGLKGHTGIDFGYFYGQPIPSLTDAYCYSVFNRDNPNLSAYRAVYTLVEDCDFVYELSYGHCSAIEAQPKTSLAGGQTVALAGNTGDVYQGNHYVTNAEKQAGSTAGTHLHFQVRKTRMVPSKTKGKQYVYDGNGLLKYKDSFLEVVDYDNGYHGCVDPEPFFDTPLPPFVFNRNLWFGTKSLDNVELQRRLGVSPTDLNFGPKTLAAVMKYQLTNGITPSHGFVGPITRAKLNAGS